MINLQLQILNPTKYRIKGFRSLFSWYRILGYKTLEFQVTRDSLYELFCFSICISWEGESHAGPRIELYILSLGFSFSFLDNRHWDFDKNCWKKD